MQDQNHQSIELLNKILSIDIDKKTEILTKYKLAKYKCIIKEYNDALEIINELINNQYFEPVALAVANPEFKEISSRILETLQLKLEEIVKSFSGEAKTKSDKINLIDIDNDFKSVLINSIEKYSNAIKESSNYSILLTSAFKESHNEFLQYLDLLSELKLKTEKELESSIQDIKKIESIAEINATIDTNYDSSFDVAQMSHRILLAKMKLNVESGINKKVSSFHRTRDFYQNADASLINGLNFIASIDSNEIIGYINTKFNLSELSFSLTPEITLEDLADKIIYEYPTIIERYNARKTIDSHLSTADSSDNYSVQEKAEIVIKTLKLISEIFNVDIGEAKAMLKNKSLTEKINQLPASKRERILNELKSYEN